MRVLYPATADYPLDWVEREPGELVPCYQKPGEPPLYPIWAPQPGSQQGFLAATPIFEALYHGNRGGGKTDTLLMDFAQHIGKGWGSEWRGILFRQTYKQLSDLVNKTQKWFRRIFPGATFNKSDYTWTFPGGEMLYLRYMNNEADYWNYHGHAYPWIGWEELCNWPTANCYTVMMSCCRSTMPNMPRCYRATTNPYGPGHNWVKKRFRLPHHDGRVIRDSLREGELEPPRVAIRSKVAENRILLTADPDYISRIRASARNPAMAAAWISGSWDIIAGGMFDDLWEPQVHKVPTFPARAIPKAWTIDRAFDWGSSHPFSVGWFAESNGEPFEYNGKWYGTVRGDLFMIREWYGCNGQPNEGLRMRAKDIARGILDREDDFGLSNRVKKGVADASIFDEENGNNIARDMSRVGVSWKAADKSPGSRKQGWEQIRKRLAGSVSTPGIPREEPGLFISSCCEWALELIPSTSRSDNDPDDVNTDTPDHIQDMLRYRVRNLSRPVTMKDM